MTKRIGFYLLGYKGYECLKQYLRTYDSNTVDFVAIGRDKGVASDYYDELLILCKLSSIKVLSKDEAHKVKSSSNLIRIAIGWKWIIQETNMLVIFHDSLLPKYRGFAPLVSALIDGQENVGVTALWASDEYDVGELILQKELKVSYPAKINEVITNIVHVYVALLLEISEKFFTGVEIISHKQKENEASYSLWRDENDYEIPWGRDSDYIKRFVDAVGAPYEGATSYLNRRKIKVFDVEVMQDVYISDREQHIGKIIKMSHGKPIIVCGQGLIKLRKFLDSESKEKPIFNFRSRFGVKV